MKDTKVILSIDSRDEQYINNIINIVNPTLCKIKIGKEAFTHFGPYIIKKINSLGFDIFLDLKFHDIPNTVFNACKSIMSLNVWMINVHSLGGFTMLQYARNAVNKKKPYIIAVTVLTSLSSNDIKNLGFSYDIKDLTIRLSILAKKAKLDGIVCSPLEAKYVREKFKKNFLIITPGISLSSNKYYDQHRFSHPISAINNGADYIVMGRSITQSGKIKYLLEKINYQINEL